MFPIHKQNQTEAFNVGFVQLDAFLPYLLNNRAGMTENSMRYQSSQVHHELDGEGLHIMSVLISVQ